MKYKTASVILLIINIILASILSIIIYKLLLIGSELESINKFAIVFSSFIFGYGISLIITRSINSLLEKLYIKSNEGKYKTNNYEYFRDIIKDYPIGAIINCYGKKVDVHDELVAIMVRLIINKKISLKDDKIIVLDKTNLSKSEDMFIKMCDGYTVYSKKYLKIELRDDNYDDSIKTNLFRHDIKSSTHGINMLSNTFGGILALCNFTLLFVYGFVFDNIIKPYTWVITFITFLIFLIIIGFTYSYKKILFKSSEGKELQAKLYGLEKFLKTFTSINEKQVEDYITWDEYIVYAIIFNLKGRLNKDVYEHYDKYLKKLVSGEKK